MRQKTQLDLAFPPTATGEARSRGAAGIEAHAARVATESLAAGGPSMEAIVERDNLRKALAQVRRNKGAVNGGDKAVHMAAQESAKSAYLFIRGSLVCSASANRFFVPTCGLHSRRAGRRSRRPEGHRVAARSVLDGRRARWHPHRSRTTRQLSRQTIVTSRPPATGNA